MSSRRLEKPKLPILGVEQHGLKHYSVALSCHCSTTTLKLDSSLTLSFYTCTPMSSYAATSARSSHTTGSFLLELLALHHNIQNCYFVQFGVYYKHATAAMSVLHRRVWEGSEFAGLASSLFYLVLEFSYPRFLTKTKSY